jgi:serine phosphatase RsbU (regulator of sigma subunit)
MMPEMDGLEFCAKVKESFGEPSIYFILLTAKDKHEDKVSALDTGADEYLVKPCDGRELMARLRAAERIIRLQQALSLSNDRLQVALRRLHSEVETASNIQRALLPQRLPQIAGYDFAAHYQPSTECSGDFYDVIALDDNRLGLVIGDVSGHGTPAMVAMTLTHMLWHQEVQRASDPAALLCKLNNAMDMYLPTEQFVTMFYGELELDSGKLTYSSAGHNPPLLIDPQSYGYHFLPGCEGFPIKLFGPNMQYENHEVPVSPGQRLVLYTDGLLEAYFTDAENRFDENRFVDSFTRNRPQTAQAILDGLLLDLKNFEQSRPLEDDLSVFITARE